MSKQKRYSKKPPPKPEMEGNGLRWLVDEIKSIEPKGDKKKLLTLYRILINWI